MLKDEVKAVLRREPFVPLEVRTSDGRRLGAPFPHVAVVMTDGLLVFHGVKDERSRVAKGYDFIAYDRIETIGPQEVPGSELPKKAS